MLAYCDCDIAAPAGTGTASDAFAFLPLRRRNSSKIAAKISNSSTNAPTPTPTGSAQSESAVDAVVKGDSEVTPPADVVCTVVSGPELVVGVDEGIDSGGSVDERGGTDVATIDVAATVAMGVFGIEIGTVVGVTGELGVVVGAACVGGIAVDVTFTFTVDDVTSELDVVVVGIDIVGDVDSCGAQHASICTRLDSSPPPN
jgi:hypothetical protein